MKTILLYKYYFLSFLLIGIIVYFPIFFNGFVWDDNIYILNNPQIHSFNTSVLFDNIFNSHFMYRQISPLYFSLLYSLFGNNPFPYHFIQLLQHIICTSLLFILFIKYFKPATSYFLSLLFLVHPINTETVAWISSTQTLQYTIFGLLALIMIHKKHMSNMYIVSIIILQFFSLLTYELGILYIVLMFIYLIQNKSKYFVKFLLLTSILFVVYAFLRIIGNSLDIQPNNHYSLALTFSERIFTIPSIITYYFRTLIFPMNLLIWQNWYIKTFSIKDVLLPTVVIQSILILYTWFYVYIKNNREIFSFFSLWFLLGLLPLLHIYPLDMTVADRWFYFPLIGLLGVVGYIGEYNLKVVRKYKSIVFITIILVLCLFSLRTLFRTFDWKNNVTLFSHDIQKQPDNNFLSYNLSGQYILKRQYKDALPYLKKLEADQEHFPAVIPELGETYDTLGDYNKAAYYYEKTLKDNIILPTNDSSLILKEYIKVLLKAHNDKQVIAILKDEETENISQEPMLLFYRATANYELKNYKDAYTDADYLYKKYNDIQIKNLYMKIKNTSNKLE